MARRGRAASPILGTASALIGAASAVLVSRDSRFRHSFEAALDSVEPDPAQARKRFDEAEIRALAGTMAEQGQLQPILVRPDPAARGRWIIVAGERRWRAARLNGWPAILAIEHDQDPEVAALIENLQRVDLAPVEEARGLERLIRTKGWSQNDAAAALGKSKAEVSATLRILSLPEDVLDAVSTSEPPLPKNALIELARVERPALRERLLARARAGTLTVRAIRDAVAAAAKAGEGAPEGGAGEAAGRPP
ncbi:MAG TPA: ParB/RepB/Spo0J family partition protein, partial [Geminicoccaceae bacterium]|nr:ParB/RepB/Spo0J family partition protein [Geminicoccaceae bacterium]